jgi:1,4-alpha-glucan branching enzyme
MSQTQGLLTEHDLYLLAEGTYARSWERLGAHVAEVDGVRGVRFAVWAPNAARVSVIGSHNGWDPAAHPMSPRETTGIWERFIPGVEPGTTYKYHVESQIGGHVADKADPYAFASEVAPGTASVVYDLRALEDHSWQDGEWMVSRVARQRPDQPISIYEVHAGSWRRVPEEGNRPLTYRELAHQLVPYVKELGFTHVELMPVTEYPFEQSWGYLVTGYFAPTSRYGSPADLLYFVEYCHQHDIGVLLDWVPAHFAREEHGLGFFDGTHLYEHADPVLGESPWGSLIFNYGRAEVRNFLLSSARFWLERYHVDGFRVDAVAFMVWLDHARPAERWGLNKYGGRENLEAVDFLRRFNAMVHEEQPGGPGAITIAEEATSYNWVTDDPTAPPDLGVKGQGSRVKREGSLGFDYKWNLGWMHDTLDYFETDPGARKEEHGLLTFPIWYAFDERYVLPFSHDEVVHLKKALLTKMPGDDWQRFANLRALLAYQTAHPGKKLLFMGGELGQWAEWDENRSLDWHLMEWSGPGGSHAPLHRGIRQCVADLNRLYREDPALHTLDSHPRGFDWIDHQDYESSVISFLRRGREPGEATVVVCNFTPVVREHYPVGVPVPGEWHEVLNTDATEYGGSGARNGTLMAVHRAPDGRRAGGGVRYGQRLLVTLPPLGVVFLKPGMA